MKIGNPADKPAPTAVAHGGGVPNSHASAAGLAHAAGTRADTRADPTPASATIELSNTASTLLTGGATAEFDAEKVARISQAIKDGSFRINPEAIADKLISNAQELLSKVRP